MTWILTLNAGSSSLKFALFEPVRGRAELHMSGHVDGLGKSPNLAVRDAVGRALEQHPVAIAAEDHHGALEVVLRLLRERLPGVSIGAVGHRVVHGGPKFGAPVVVDDAVLAELAELTALAPLHQPHNLDGIAAARAAFPDALQVACFDTAFHRAHPWVNDTFGLPRRFYDKGVRRYGFHGLSYESVTQRLAAVAPHHARGRVVVAHLGSGASMCAIRDGRSIGSTMGFSALDGLPMGTRCGQLDPGVLLYLHEHEGLTTKQISDLLYKESGLKGLSGLDGDMRALEAAGTPEARQAIDYFVFRVRRELGAMTAILNGLDALVFCGGIGENSAHIRQRICSGLDWLGIELDDTRNEAGELVVSSDVSRARVMVIKTDEEAMIAQHVIEHLNAPRELVVLETSRMAGGTRGLRRRR
jgi:acetate kinase